MTKEQIIKQNKACFNALKKQQRKELLELNSEIAIIQKEIAILHKEIAIIEKEKRRRVIEGDICD